MNTTVRIEDVYLGAMPFVLKIGVGVLGVALLIGLLALLASPRTRGPVMGLLLVLGFLAVTGWFVQVRTSEERLRQDVAWQAGAQMRPHALPEQPAPEQPAGDENVTVVLSPPDRTTAGKAADEGISVKIHQDGRTGKGTIIYVKANRMLEALGKALLDTIREQGNERPAEATKSSLVHAKPAVVAPAAPVAPGQDAAPAKSAASSSPKTPRAPAGAARTAPPPAKSSSAPDKAPPPGSGASEETVTGYGNTEAECVANLDDELQKAFSRYVQRRQGAEDAGEVQFPAGDLRKFIVRSSQDEVESGTLGPIIRTTAVVNFDRAYQAFRLSQRLWYVGGGLGAVLLLLSLAYGYLKIDLATGGAYRWRLRLAVATILCGMGAAAAAFLG